VPMLVQSCLDAFLATVVEVNDSLRASPSLVSLLLLFSAHEPFVPSARTAGSTICPSDARGLPGSTFGGGLSTPSNRPYIYTAVIERGELTLPSATFLHNYVSI